MLSKSPLYVAHYSMLYRVGHNPRYSDVRVDPRWLTFELFVAHPPLAESPFGEPHREFEPGLCLCRTGDVGDYSPENCRWDTKSNNMREYWAHTPRVLYVRPSRAALDDVVFTPYEMENSV